MQEAIKAESCSLAMIAIKKREIAVDILTIFIGQCVLYFNVGKTMQPPQILLVTEMLLNDPILKNLKPEDYRVLFEDMKKGYYGNLYDRFDGQIIFQNATKYADHRQSLIETESINMAHAHKNNDIVIHPKILETYKEGLNESKDIKTQKVTTAVKLSEKGYEVNYDLVAKKQIVSEDKKISHRDPEVQNWFKEFEVLRNDKKTSLKGGQFIKYKDKILNQAEFLDEKIKEKNKTEEDENT